MPTLKRADRARIYRLTGQLLAAGVPPQALCEALERGFRSLSARLLVARMRNMMAEGNPISEAFLRSTDLGIPVTDARLLRAAEAAGNPSNALYRLAAADEQRAAEFAELQRRSAYPLFLLHMALIAPSASALMLSPWPTILGLLAFLVPLDLAIFAIFRALAAPRASPAMTRLARRLPPIDAIAIDREGANFLGTLHQFYEAGVPVLTAAREALDAVAHDDLRERYDAALRSGADGEPFRDVVARFPLRHVEIIGTLAVAETAGTLGEALGSAARYLDERASTAQAAFVKRSIAVLIAVAMLYAGLRIVSFWSDYYGQISAAR
jgi:type II secretory pathway component PulF